MDLEQQLSELADRHVGLFLGALSHINDATPDTAAHALWLLAHKAEARRDEWTNMRSNPRE